MKPNGVNAGDSANVSIRYIGHLRQYQRILDLCVNNLLNIQTTVWPLDGSLEETIALNAGSWLIKVIRRQLEHSSFSLHYWKVRHHIYSSNYDMHENSKNAI